MTDSSIVDFNADHFALFGLPFAFRIDADRLDQRFREVQSQVHPDRFAHAGDAERRLSLQWATRVNEGYQVLKTPLSRAKYLLHLAGVESGIDNNLSMPPDFLMEQMEWREAVAEARQARDYDELEQILHRVKQGLNSGYERLGVLLDDRRDYPEAADCVRRLMFLEKLLAEIEDAMAAVEDWNA